jgi:hypothetical protein
MSDPCELADYATLTDPGFFECRSAAQRRRDRVGDAVACFIGAVVAGLICWALSVWRLWD